MLRVVTDDEGRAEMRSALDEIVLDLVGPPGAGRSYVRPALGGRKRSHSRWCAGATDRTPEKQGGEVAGDYVRAGCSCSEQIAWLGGHCGQHFRSRHTPCVGSDPEHGTGIFHARPNERGWK